MDYVERHGDARVPPDYSIDGFELGRWVSKQRIFHSKGALDVARQRQLQDLSGWTWDHPDDAARKLAFADHAIRHAHALMAVPSTEKPVKIEAEIINYVACSKDTADVVVVVAHDNHLRGVGTASLRRLQIPPAATEFATLLPMRWRRIC